MQQYLTKTQRKQLNQIKKRMKTNQTGTRIIITTEHKYKHKQKTKKFLKLLTENKLLSNVYNNT